MDVLLSCQCDFWHAAWFVQGDFCHVVYIFFALISAMLMTCFVLGGCGSPTNWRDVLFAVSLGSNVQEVGCAVPSAGSSGRIDSRRGDVRAVACCRALMAASAVAAVDASTGRLGVSRARDPLLDLSVQGFFGSFAKIMKRFPRFSCWRAREFFPVPPYSLRIHCAFILRGWECSNSRMACIFTNRIFGKS